MLSQEYSTVKNTFLTTIGVIKDVIYVLGIPAIFVPACDILSIFSNKLIIYALLGFVMLFLLSIFIKIRYNPFWLKEEIIIGICISAIFIVMLSGYKNIMSSRSLLADEFDMIKNIQLRIADSSEHINDVKKMDNAYLKNNFTRVRDQLFQLSESERKQFPAIVPSRDASDYNACIAEGDIIKLSLYLENGMPKDKKPPHEAAEPIFLALDDNIPNQEEVLSLLVMYGYDLNKKYLIESPHKKLHDDFSDLYNKYGRISYYTPFALDAFNGYFTPWEIAVKTYQKNTLKILISLGCSKTEIINLIKSLMDDIQSPKDIRFCEKNCKTDPRCSDFPSLIPDWRNITYKNLEDILYFCQNL